MQIFQLDSLKQDRQTIGSPYREFLRVADMSAGLYHLEPGNPDPQGAHAEDVLFYVMAGAATLQVGDDTVEVSAGSVVHIPKRVAPRFTAVHAAIDVLVVFSPAESAPTLPEHMTAG
ncbi:cupin domain-containing protein [Chitinimonas sp. BJYL2]|uniref:cupin domain-containing protein n=1 Tax=Chitinimonas sp. BJYL2 TaxID=2976696 RepID=UPI0022B32B08|nr:cupin domain-containing protein [Chitinimonas sp. BJYL2]